MAQIAYSYTRFSSPAQSKGDSVRRQTEAAEAYAAEFGLTLDSSLRDAGVSAYRGDHRQTGALSRFLALAREGRVVVGSFLLVDSFDRLSRERSIDAVGLLCDICRAGITIVTLNDGRRFDPDTPMEQMMWAVLGFARAHHESSEKSRVLKLRRQKERDRARHSLTPFSPAGPHWLRLQPIPLDRRRPDGPEKEWVEVRERADVVREIFDLKDSGLGYAAIARRLNERGEPTPRPRRDPEGNVISVWTEAAVGDLIGRRTVLGEYAPHRGHRKAGSREPDGPTIPGFYPAIVSEAQFDRVHAAIAARRNSNARPRTSTFNNLLLGLVRCRCGGLVGYLESGRLKNGRRSAALRCPGVYRGVCDNRVRLNYPRVEAELLPFLAGLPDAQPSVKAAAALATAQAERADLERRIEVLLDQLEAGTSVSERLRQREVEKVALDDRIATLEAEAMRERADASAPDWRTRLGLLVEQMATAEGEALFAIRARLNGLIGQAVGGGFEFRDGRLFAILNKTRAKGRPPLFHRTEESLIQWEFAPLTPSLEQVRAGVDAAA